MTIAAVNYEVQNALSKISFAILGQVVNALRYGICHMVAHRITHYNSPEICIQTVDAQIFFWNNPGSC